MLCVLWRGEDSEKTHDVVSEHDAGPSNRGLQDKGKEPEEEGEEAEDVGLTRPSLRPISPSLKDMGGESEDVGSTMPRRIPCQPSFPPPAHLRSLARSRSPVPPPPRHPPPHGWWPVGAPSPFPIPPLGFSFFHLSQSERRAMHSSEGWRVGGKIKCIINNNNSYAYIIILFLYIFLSFSF